MKNKTITLLLLLSFHVAVSQVTYYKGEWRVPGKADLFTCICKLEIQQDSVITAEYAWVFQIIDSTNTELLELYKNKNGKTGIEFAKGTYHPGTGDIYLEATGLDDPHEILGMTKYLLKMSADKQTLYGNTLGVETDDPGLFCAVKMKSSGRKKYDKLKQSVKAKE